MRGAAEYAKKPRNARIARKHTHVIREVRVLRGKTSAASAACVDVVAKTAIDAAEKLDVLSSVRSDTHSLDESQDEIMVMVSIAPARLGLLESILR